MTTRRSLKYSAPPLVVAIILLAMFFTASGFAANYPLEIIQPQTGLTTTNRYYKAYPGIEYNVKVGVFGGTFPFVYSLTTYPAGMTINADTGIIRWSNPTTSGSPHNVTVSVTDSENTTVTRSWTVTVTTSGFYFIDSANGNDSNSGTIASPWKTIGGMYKNNKYDTTYSGGFLYFRAGTYLTTGTGMVLEDGWRLSLRLGAKPVVWMGYPGEQATIDTKGAAIGVYDSDNVVYFDNLRIINMRAVNGCETNHGLHVSGNISVFRRLNFYNQGIGSVGCNDSSLMFLGGNNVLISENTGDTGTSAYWLLGYHASKVVVEYNTISNWGGGSHIIGPKTDNRYWSIRKNTAIDNLVNNDGVIWIDTYATTNNFDISFNNIKTSGVALSVGLELPGYGPVYSYRNTYQGSIEVMNYTSGAISFVQDIIINSNTSKIKYSGVGTPTQTNLLTGTVENNIVDGIGFLQSTYRTNYLGTRGWEMTTAPASPLKPSPPLGVQINAN